jgi:predicted dehydrogenase
MSKKLNVAVIGAGAIGIDHVWGYQGHPSAQVAVIVDNSVERAEAAARAHQIPEVETDFKKILKRKDIDIISIALPNYLHADVGVLALQAGKHLMLDKPMATNAKDGARLLAAAKKARKVFMVGQNQRFSPAAQTVKQLVVSGKLGEVYHAKAVWRRRAGIPRIGSWFTQIKFAGGGAAYDIGVHVLDLALHLMGEFDAVAVSGKTFNELGRRGVGEGGWGKSEIDPRRPFDVDDMALAMIKMKSGHTVLLEASWAAHQPEGDINGVHLFGTKAGATTNPLQYFHPVGENYRVEELRPGTPYVPHNRMVHFIDVVLGKAKSFVPPEQSLAVQKILDAIYQSSRTGREVRL